MASLFANRFLIHFPKNTVWGWSNHKINPLDLLNVTKYEYYERLFCIINRDYPYTVDIEYYNPYNKTNISPVITTGGIGISNNSVHVTKSNITRRFQTEDDCKKFISDITAKKALIDKAITNMVDQYMPFLED